MEIKLYRSKKKKKTPATVLSGPEERFAEEQPG